MVLHVVTGCGLRMRLRELYTRPDVMFVVYRELRVFYAAIAAVHVICGRVALRCSDGCMSHDITYMYVHVLIVPIQ